MPNRRSTLQDIADSLDLSRTTVSLALRDHPRISQATKDRIRGVASKIGYQPDRIARSLATGHSSLIGLIVPDSTNAYYAEVIRGIEAAAHANGYSVVLANGSYNPELEAAKIREITQLRVAGIIAAPAFRSERPKLDGIWLDLHQRKFPFVLLNRQLNPPIFHQVSADNVSGTRMAVEALASLGHRRVAYLYGKRATVPARQRLAAFRRFGRKHQFDQNSDLIEPSDVGTRGGYEACARLWSRLKRKPTAIMTLSDAEALGVLRYLRERNIAVPDDVSVMGFDGFEQAEFSPVSLSTVVTPMREIGKQSVEMVKQLIEKTFVPRSVILPVRLALRESVGPPKVRR